MFCKNKISFVVGDECKNHNLTSKFVNRSRFDSKSNFSNQNRRVEWNFDNETNNNAQFQPHYRNFPFFGISALQTFSSIWMISKKKPQSIFRTRIETGVNKLGNITKKLNRFGNIIIKLET